MVCSVYSCFKEGGEQHENVIADIKLLELPQEVHCLLTFVQCGDTLIRPGKIICDSSA